MLIISRIEQQIKNLLVVSKNITTNVLGYSWIMIHHRSPSLFQLFSTAVNKRTIQTMGLTQERFSRLPVGLQKEISRHIDSLPFKLKICTATKNEWLHYLPALPQRNLLIQFLETLTSDQTGDFLEAFWQLDHGSPEFQKQANEIIGQLLHNLVKDNRFFPIPQLSNNTPYLSIPRDFPFHDLKTLCLKMRDNEWQNLSERERKEIATNLVSSLWRLWDPALFDWENAEKSPFFTRFTASPLRSLILSIPSEFLIHSLVDSANLESLEEKFTSLFEEGEATNKEFADHLQQKEVFLSLFPMEKKDAWTRLFKPILQCFDQENLETILFFLQSNRDTVIIKNCLQITKALLEGLAVHTPGWEKQIIEICKDQQTPYDQVKTFGWFISQILSLGIPGLQQGTQPLEAIEAACAQRVNPKDAPKVNQIQDAIRLCLSAGVASDVNFRDLDASTFFFLYRAICLKAIQEDKIDLVGRCFGARKSASLIETLQEARKEFLKLENQDLNRLLNPWETTHEQEKKLKRQIEKAAFIDLPQTVSSFIPLALANMDATQKREGE